MRALAATSDPAVWEPFNDALKKEELNNPRVTCMHFFCSLQIIYLFNVDTVSEMCEI